VKPSWISNITRPCLLRVDSAITKREQDESISRLKSLPHRCPLVARRNTILSRSRLGLLRFFHLPIRLDSPLPRQLATSYPCMYPYIRAVHSCLVYRCSPMFDLRGVDKSAGSSTMIAMSSAPSRASLGSFGQTCWVRCSMEPYCGFWSSTNG
jgi:hypothetical protein